MEVEQPLRLAALADLHYGRADREEVARVLGQASEAADVLLLCGDLTDHGRPGEAHRLVDDIPPDFRHRVLCVLGNHDHATDEMPRLIEVLEEAGVRVLDGDSVTIDGVGFAGVSGFCGGFGDRAVHPFGEPVLRDFIDATVQESLKLEKALIQLDTDHKVVLMHYSPIRGTVEGEPLEIYPFLGASRLESPLNDYGVDVAFHGHAHKGSPEGRTSTGVPVFNVSIPVLKRARPGRAAFRVFEVGDR